MALYGTLSPLSAQVYTWSGTGTESSPTSGNWNAAGAWSGDTLSAGGPTTQLDFGGSGGTAYSATNNLSALTINGITLDSSATVAETIGLGSLTFGGTSPFITQLGSGAFTLNGASTLGAMTALGGTGTGLVSLTGVVGGTGGFNVTGGAYALTGNNTFTGGVNLSGGVLEVGSNFALGTGALTITGGQLSSASTATYALANALSVGGAFALGDAVNTGTLNLQGAVTMTSNVDITTYGAQQMRGAWTDAGGYALTVEGPGTLQLLGSIAALGSITVNGGGLSLTQGSAVTPFQGTLTLNGATFSAGVSGASGQLGKDVTSVSQVILQSGSTWNLNSGNGISQYLGSLVVGSASDTSSTQLLMGSSAVGYGENIFITGAGVTGNVFTLQGSAAAPAILNLGGSSTGSFITGGLTFDSASGGQTVFFGPNGQIVATGNYGVGGGFNPIYASILDVTSANGISTNPFTYDFAGTTINGSTFSVGSKLGTRAIADTINIMASLGDGSGTLISSYAGVVLDWTGAVDVGAAVLSQQSPIAAIPWIRVASTATEMTGGIIVGAGGAATPGIYTGNTSLTFDPGGTSFKIDAGAVLDDRDGTAAQGVVTQNNTSLIVDGALRGNSLADDSAVSGTPGTVKIESGGEFALASDNGTYTVSATGVGVNNRTIYDMAGGTFSLGGSFASAISVASAGGLDQYGQTGTGGTSTGWNGGIVNADGSHTITDTSGILGNASLWPGSVYVVGAGGGLNGLSVAEASFFPTTGTLLLNAGSSLLVKDTTAATAGAATASQYSYTILPYSGTGAFSGTSPLIVAPDSGGFTFGISQANPSIAHIASGSSAIIVNGNTATLTLNASPSSYNLAPGGLIYLAGNAGTNGSAFNGAFVITGISGNSVTFQLYQTPAGPPDTSNTSIYQDSAIHLARDKGADDISLVNNTTGGYVAIDTAQSGSGNLYVNTSEIALNSSFAGTGGIYAGNVVPGSGWTNGGGLANTGGAGAYGVVNGMTSPSVLLSVAGALGTSASDNITISLNALLNNNPNGGGSAMVLQSTASLAGTQNWILDGYGSNNLSPLLVNQITDPTRWNADVSLTIEGGASTYGTIEAATSTADPAHPADYKFGVLTLAPAAGAYGYLELVNNVENDLAGGVRDTGKEAFYATALDVTTGANSQSTAIFDLNGQDLYLSQFAPVTQAYSGSYGRWAFQNDAAGTISDIRAIDSFGQNLNVGSFRTTENATLEIVNGNWRSLQWAGAVATSVPGDTSAAPNVGVSGTGDTRTTLLYNGSNGLIGANISYLGSGAATGGNTSTSDGGTANNGTFRVVNGSFASSSYILNPVGAVGTIDTTTTYAGGALPGAPSGNAAIGGTTSGIVDDTYDTVTVRGNAAYTVTGVNAATNTLTLNASAAPVPWQVGDTVVLSGSVTGANLGATVFYIASVTGSGPTTTVQLSTTPGGPVMALNAAWFGSGTAVADPMGAGTSTAYPALVVAGTTNVIGDLDIAPVAGAVNQATLRVGGNTPGATLTSASPTGTGILNVLGNFTVGAAGATSQANLAVQGNGVVNVGGDVAVYGVGTAQGNNVTGFVNGSATGVGFDALSNFTLNGNTLGASPSYAGNPSNGTAQKVSLANGVSFGKFHVGDGAAGVLTPNGPGGGFAAQAQLQGDVAAATSADINGATSRLDLNGHTLTVGGGSGVLTNGGILLGTGGGTVAATVKLSGAASSILAPGSGALSMTALDAVNGGGLSFVLGANTAAGTLGSLFLGTVTTSGAVFTFDFSGTAVAGTTYDLLSFLTAGSDLASVSQLQLSSAAVAQGWGIQSWSFLSGTGGGADTTLAVVFSSTPEPTTVGLGLLGLGALALGLRRRMAA